MAEMKKGWCPCCGATFDATDEVLAMFEKVNTAPAAAPASSPAVKPAVLVPVAILKPISPKVIAAADNPGGTVPKVPAVAAPAAAAPAAPAAAAPIAPAAAPAAAAPASAAPASAEGGM